MSSTLLLGKHTERPVENTLFLGAVGTGAWSFMEENIKHQDTTSMVIVDRRNYLYRSTVDTLIKKGYTVQVVDVCEDIDKSVQVSYGNMVKNYNPFAFMESDVSILNFATILSKLRFKTEEEIKKKQFNFDSMKKMLVNYLIYLKGNGCLSSLTMKELYEKTMNGGLDAFIMKDASKLLVDSTSHDIACVLSDLNDSMITSGENKLNLMSLLTEEKQVLFIETKNEVNDSVNLLYVTLLEQLLRMRGDIKFSAASSDHTEFLFFLSSEFPVSLIPDFNNYMLMTRNMHFVMEAQVIEQFLFADNMEYIIYGGDCRNDVATMEFLSKIAGTDHAKTAFKLDVFDRKHVIPHRHVSLIKKKRTYNPQSFSKVPFAYEYIFEKEGFTVDEKFK